MPWSSRTTGLCREAATRPCAGKVTMSGLRSYEGPALLSYGFRPFFLFGSIYAGLAVLL